MIVKIQEDIYAYDPKLFGNFTVRQVVSMTISFVLIAVIFIPLYLCTGDVTLPGFTACMAGVPVMFAGMLKKDGLPYEKYVLLKMRAMRHPKKRPYRMNNIYEDVIVINKELSVFEEEQRTEEEAEQD